MNVEASGNAPSLLGINARQGIFSIHAMNPIKFVDHAKTVTQQQETVPQQQEIATPATQGKTQKPVTLILYIEEVRPDGSVIPVPNANITGQEGTGNNFQKTVENNSHTDHQWNLRNLVIYSIRSRLCHHKLVTNNDP